MNPTRLRPPQTEAGFGYTAIWYVNVTAGRARVGYLSRLRKKMAHLLYIYAPVLKRSEVLAFLTELDKSGNVFTHLDKRDNPKKWTGDRRAAADLILSGGSGTNYTFFRTQPDKFEGDMQIHNDPRWQHDTISMSSPDQKALLSFGQALRSAIRHYVMIDGVSGRGKEQAWHVLSLAADCPRELKDRIGVAKSGTDTEHG